MIGEGFLYIYDYAVLLQGEGTLTVGSQLHSVTFTGEGTMSIESSQNYGWASLPALASFGGEFAAGSGWGAATLPAMTSSGEGGMYIPPYPEFGFAFLPSLTSFGLLTTSSPGSGEATLPAMISKGGEGNYGEGSASLPGLVSFGWDDPFPFEAQLISTAYVFAGAGAKTDMIVFISESGQISGTITCDRELLESILNNMTLDGTFSVIGDYLVSAMASATGTSTASPLINHVTEDETVATDDTGTVGTTVTVETGTGGETITTTTVVTEDAGVYTTTTTVETSYLRAALDSDSRVWVVNMDTGQSSQYEDYGFNSYFERDGEYFGVADDGVYQLTGDTDAGLPIETYVDFGKSDCGVHGVKKVPNVHVGTSDGSDMYLRVTTDSGTATYRLEQCYRGPTGWRARVPQTDMQGWNWRWELIASNAFELHGVEFAPVKLNKRM